MDYTEDNYLQTRYTFNKDRDVVWRAICKYLQRFIGKDKTIVDLGSGYCNFINNIKGANKIAVDMNSSFKSYCDPDVTFYEGSATFLPFLEDNSIDIFFISNLFEHLNDKELDEAMQQIKLKLKNKGRVILLQPNFKYCYRDYFDDFTHVKVFSHVSLADFLMSKDLEIVKCFAKFIPFSLKSRLPKSYWLTRLYLELPFKIFAKQMLIVAEIKK